MRDLQEYYQSRPRHICAVQGCTNAYAYQAVNTLICERHAKEYAFSWALASGEIKPVSWLMNDRE